MLSLASCSRVCPRLKFAGKNAEQLSQRTLSPLHERNRGARGRPIEKLGLPLNAN